MPDEKKVEKDGEGAKPSNPSPEEKANPPKQEPQPQTEPGTSADLKQLKDQLAEVDGKLDRYKEQVKGSSEEARRLKEENDALKTRLAELSKGGVSTSDPRFQEIMEENGLEAAVNFAINSEIASLKKRVDVFEKNESGKVYTDFKASHKGLKDPDVLTRFDAEFERLKNVYSDIDEALEKSYVLAGGPQAETVETPKVDDPQKHADEEKVRKNVIGGEEDIRPAKPADDDKESLQKRINDLQHQAMALQNQGRIRQATELLSEAEDLKAALAEKI